MGLLDGLLGQVLGGMAQGGGARGAPGTGGLGDLLNQLGGAQRGAPGMGGLGDLLNQMGGMPGSPSAGAGPGGMPQSGGGMGGAAIGALVMLALQMLQRNGGLDGVLGRLRESGHAREADSWVGTGENAPITPDALSQIFGREEFDQAAQQMGMEPDQARGGLASIFPELVNEMTPQGRVESGTDDMVARTLEILQRNQR